MSTTKLAPLRGPPPPGARRPTMRAVVQHRDGPMPEDLLQVAQIGRPTTRGTLVIVGSETDGRWLGGFDRTILAMLLSPFVRQTLAPLANSENAADLIVLTGLIESGKVTPVVDRTYPLEEAAAAIRHLLDGKARGKVVVSLSPSDTQTPPPRSTP